MLYLHFIIKDNNNYNNNIQTKKAYKLKQLIKINSPSFSFFLSLRFDFFITYFHISLLYYNCLLGVWKEKGEKKEKKGKKPSSIWWGCWVLAFIPADTLNKDKLCLAPLAHGCWNICVRLLVLLISCSLSLIPGRGLVSYSDRSFVHALVAGLVPSGAVAFTASLNQEAQGAGCVSNSSSTIDEHASTHARLNDRGSTARLQSLG